MSELRRYETRDGPMLAFPGDIYVTRSLELYGEFSPGERRLFEQIVKPGAPMVEIGANIGAHTVALARLCAPSVLYAFEPQHRIFQALCANLAMNNIANVVAWPDACGEAPGWATLPPLDYGASANFGGVSLLPEGGAGPPVKVVPLDELELHRCQAIKIDVEGFEPQVLRGARVTIGRCRPVLYVENDRPGQQQEVIDLLDELGYVAYWHTPPLFEAQNFRGATENIFPNIVSINVLALPKEKPSNISAPAIDPKNWRSPVVLS